MRRSSLHSSYQIYQAEPPRLINPAGLFNLLIIAILHRAKIEKQIKFYKTQFKSYFQESKNDA